MQLFAPKTWVYKDIENILNGYTDYSSIGIKNGRSRCPARDGLLLVKLYFDLTYSILEI